MPTTERVETKELARRIAAGDRRALARGLSLLENNAVESERLLAELFPASGRARVIGITGPPGAGKSTLASALARLYRGRGECVALLAVDPSSAFSGGALLGDRIRMQEHWQDAGIYIRSMATRGALGGLGAATPRLAAALDAAGFHRILIETVGVGQDEIEIARAADLTLLVLVPGMGDEVQAIKAGVMEIADILVVNKADRGPERLEQELRSALSLGEPGGGWKPPIVRTVATTGEGLNALAAAMDDCEAWLERSHERSDRRRRQWRQRLESLLQERLWRRLNDATTARELDRMAEAIAAGQVNPYRELDRLLERLCQKEPLLAKAENPQSVLPHAQG